MTLKSSKRGAVPPFIVMDVMRAANKRQVEGEDVLHMEVGQPATGAPETVLAAASEILRADVLGYTDAFGVPPLRQRISTYYQEEYGVEVDAKNIVVTSGSSGAFVVAFLAVFDSGDRVALAAPGYPAYRNILSALGIEVVSLEVGPETNFQPTPAILDRISGSIDGLIVASPSNPTGTMIKSSDLETLTAYCRNRSVRLISDEIYHGIAYGEKAQTVRAFWDEAIVINSFSKYFSMTGWRLGWMVVPDDLLRSVECLSQNLYISPPTLSQYAAVAAFDGRDELDANVARYRENRNLLLEQLPKAGFNKLASADGAFYIYADVGHLTNDSNAFCQKMLAETGVAATPGIDFDPERGHRYVRFSFSGSTKDMAQAVERLINWLAP